jgi:hypothetical protein
MNSVLVVLVALLALTGVQAGYQLSTTYAGNTFFDGWTFWNTGDPTHGYVKYLSKADAQSQGLISTNDSFVYIGADYKNVASGSGRASVRLTSTQTFQYGLFVIDLSHMPTGCGTWPAWWTVGPNWPNGGEIDVIEGVNVQNSDQATLHTNAGCSIANEDKSKFTGTMGSSNCQGNTGCGIRTTAGSYGAAFNSHQGGVYALEWTPDFIQTWYFARGSVPADITNNSPSPNPAGWGKPFAYFQQGSACPNSHFQKHQMVIDLTFCGDWAGAVFGNDCPGKGSCNDFVKNNPGEFKEAYWTIHFIKVFLNK